MKMGPNPQTIVKADFQQDKDFTSGKMNRTVYVSSGLAHQQHRLLNLDVSNTENWQGMRCSF